MQQDELSTATNLIKGILALSQPGLEDKAILCKIGGDDYYASLCQFHYWLGRFMGETA